jgi:hypothetical protein
MDNNAIRCLKKQTVDMFLEYIEGLEVGKYYKYNNILHNIAYLQIHKDLDKDTSIYEHLRDSWIK